MIGHGSDALVPVVATTGPHRAIERKHISAQAQRPGMHKDELLELHEQMVIIMEYFKDLEHVDEDLFEAYEEIDVTPDDVHMSKSEHKHAVFVLGNALANAMSEDEFSDAGRVGKRMRELAEDAERKL